MAYAHARQTPATSPALLLLWLVTLVGGQIPPPSPTTTTAIVSRWLFEMPICTGMGDRLGHIVALSALARLSGHANATVLMEWCADGQRAAQPNPMHKVFIPGWTGYDYPLERVRAHLALPDHVELFPEGASPSPPYGLVTTGHLAPPIRGITTTSTLYWKALRLAGVEARSGAEYLQAFQHAGRQLTAAAASGGAGGGRAYVLVHFRCADHNTYVAPGPMRFCTRRVLRRVQAAGLAMQIVSNNHTLAAQWMHGLRLDADVAASSYSVYTDLQLALGAAAIVQHSSEGWSAYTSVPAMAHGIPLLNTYSGADHRFDYFMQMGDLPDEFFRCRQSRRFVAAALRRAAHRGPAFVDEGRR